MSLHDRLTEGALVVRLATSEAVVMPPVDTSGWAAEGLDGEIEAIRARYLEILERS